VQIDTSKSENDRVVILSSADRDVYRDLSPAAFTIRIKENAHKKTLRLKSVALDSIAFPHSMYTIDHSNDTLYITEDGDGSAEHPTMFYQRIPHGSYNVTTLVDKLNDEAANWTPITSVAAPTTGSFSATVDTTNNVYVWAYDSDSKRMTLNVSNVTGTRDVGIHCPAFRSQRERNFDNRQFLTDIRVTSASLTSTGTNILRINTAGTKHNIRPNAVISEIVLRSRQNPSRTYVTRNVMFFTNASYITDSTGTVGYGAEYIQIEISGITATWNGIFDSDDKAVEGVMRVTAGRHSAWHTLGFHYSTENAYTPIPILSVSDGNATITPSRTEHHLTTGLPMILDAAATL
ncbi:MAG TPA: hypothetical protein VLA24_15490, partial [Pseudomonadales bacterium]|nr:hypothetical protein [Pseudomonadales bacterium]